MGCKNDPHLCRVGRVWGTRCSGGGLPNGCLDHHYGPVARTGGGLAAPLGVSRPPTGFHRFAANGTTRSRTPQGSPGSYPAAGPDASGFRVLRPRFLPPYTKVFPPAPRDAPDEDPWPPDPSRTACPTPWLPVPTPACWWPSSSPPSTTRPSTPRPCSSPSTPRP